MINPLSVEKLRRSETILDFGVFLLIPKAMYCGSSFAHRVEMDVMELREIRPIDTHVMLRRSLPTLTPGANAGEHLYYDIRDPSVASTLLQGDI